MTFKFSKELRDHYLNESNIVRTEDKTYCWNNPRFVYEVKGEEFILLEKSQFPKYLNECIIDNVKELAKFYNL